MEQNSQSYCYSHFLTIYNNVCGRWNLRKPANLQTCKPSSLDVFAERSHIINVPQAYSILLLIERNDAFIFR